MLRLGKLEGSGGILLAAALLFCMDPGDLIPLAALAAGFHELGHWTAVRLMGGGRSACCASPLQGAIWSLTIGAL